jgi:hypothetical protein
MFRNPMLPLAVGLSLCVSAFAADSKDPLRVAVIGASASAGFGCTYRLTKDDGEYMRSFRLIDMVQCACDELELKTLDTSSGFFFFSPVKNGAAAAKRASEFNPECVVALDFLFWYCYGEDGPTGEALKSESERLDKFELGLKELGVFTVPVLVGDIPNMQRAVGKMLSESQMPSADTLAKANARLAEWAKDRANVRVLPLAAMQDSLMTTNSLEINGRKLVGTEDAPLLQRDQLHPAPHGMAGLACAVADAIKENAAEKAGDCTADPKATLERAQATLRKVVRPAPKEPPAPAGSAK